MEAFSFFPIIVIVGMLVIALQVFTRGSMGILPLMLVGMGFAIFIIQSDSNLFSKDNETLQVTETTFAATTIQAEVPLREKYAVGGEAIVIGLLSLILIGAGGFYYYMKKKKKEIDDGKD